MTAGAPRGERLVFQGADLNRLVGTVYRGGARPVLLLHGGGQTRHAFDDAARRIAGAGFLAVTLDQRGHGESEWVANGAYAFADYARDVEAVAAALRRESGLAPVAVGASMGGIASLSALGRSPDALAGLVLVDVTPRLDRSGVEAVLGFMAERAELGFSSIEEAADAIAAYLPHRERPRSLAGLRKNLRRSDDGRWRWHWDPRFIHGTRSIDQDAAATETALLAAAAGLRAPALLVRGRSSELVTEEHAREFLALAPDAEYADIAGARHMVAGDRNDVFTAAILDFLTRRFGAAARALSAAD
ncbi:alpha/beta hydrolase [Alsobacter sp. KACC 23698]|uniref:Alpha/beta hydrolase n=1 Tax=Alsobacter sp. KACC 23698 TaxID=3149229 RepID=A0AAU7JAF4_9HYPH